MRNKILLVLAGLVLAALPAAGQQPPPGGDPIGEYLFPPDLVMSHQQALKLDDSQKAFIRSEVLKAQSRFTELQWQLQDAMEGMIAILKKDVVDEPQALAQLDKVLNFEREIKRTQIGLMARIKNKLTPEQQSLLRQFKAEAAQPGPPPGPPR